MENKYTQPMNPWLSIWIRPRATIQNIVETNPGNSVMLLAALAGLAGFLGNAMSRNLGDTTELPMIFLNAAIFGSVLGIISLYVVSAVVSWTGKWIGGEAPLRNIRAALAWSSVPIVWQALLWVPKLALFGQELFTSHTPRIATSPFLSLSLRVFGVIDIIIGIWAWVVLLKCLGQVQGFSAWKALGNMLLAGLILFVPVAIFIFCIGYFMPNLIAVPLR